jgi:hypothetical protein
MLENTHGNETDTRIPWNKGKLTGQKPPLHPSVAVCSPTSTKAFLWVAH